MTEAVIVVSIHEPNVLLDIIRTTHQIHPYVLFYEVTDSESALRYVMMGILMMVMAEHQIECLLNQAGSEMEVMHIIVIHVLNAHQAIIRTMQLIQLNVLHHVVMDTG